MRYLLICIMISCPAYTDTRIYKCEEHDFFLEIDEIGFDHNIVSDSDNLQKNLDHRGINATIS
jgi:hypothetical protein